MSLHFIICGRHGGVDVWSSVGEKEMGIKGLFSLKDRKRERKKKKRKK